MANKDLSIYTLIILTNPTDSANVQRLSTYASEHSIPLFYTHCNGFYAQFSVQLPSLFPIVDTHPDPASMQDLRLLAPWPELLDLVHVKTNDLETQSDHDHGHVPYLLLLLHYLEKWKRGHDDKYPENYGEKSKFRDMVRAGTRTANPEGGEENFDEAVAAVLKSLNPPTIPRGLQDILNMEECKSPNTKVRLPFHHLILLFPLISASTSCTISQQSILKQH